MITNKITIRTEINGLEVQVTKNELVFWYDGDIVFSCFISESDSTLLHRLFERKDMAGCSFFDMVQSRIDRSLAGSRLRRQ